MLLCEQGAQALSIRSRRAERSRRADCVSPAVGGRCPRRLGGFLNVRRAFAFFLLLTLAAAAPARADEAFRIGVLNDQSGPYADLSGPGGAESARMAIEDFGGSVLGKPIELLVADHQNKVDVGLAVARQWYDERGVRAIFDITNSGVGLAVQDLAKARDRIVIFNSASSSDLTGKACSPNGVQWNADNWSNGVALMRLLIKQKLDSFFFITADYAFGASLEADARDAIAKAGGTVVGERALAAQHRRFQLVSHRRPGIEGQGDRVRDHRRRSLQRAETGERVQPRAGQYLATPITYLSDVNAAGLDVAHGLTFMQSWYWDLDDKTREFAKRFYARRGRMPNDNQVAVYSSVRHYLEAVAKAGTDDTAGGDEGDARGADPRCVHRQWNDSRRRAGAL